MDSIVIYLNDLSICKIYLRLGDIMTYIIISRFYSSA